MHRYVKTRKEKIMVQERRFHYNSEKIILVTAWSHALGLLGLIDRPPSLEGSTIYTYVCLLDKIYKVLIYLNIYPVSSVYLGGC